MDGRGMRNLKEICAGVKVIEIGFLSKVFVVAEIGIGISFYPV